MHTVDSPGVHPTRRFYLGLGLSIALHAVVVLNIAPASYRNTSAPLLLTVDIQPRSLEQASASPLPERSAPPLVEATPEAAPTVIEPATQQPASRADAPPTADQKMVGYSAPQDYYFTLAEIEVRPQPINEVDLVYPALAYAMRTRGKVLLTLFISEEGAVDDVKLIGATPPGIFEEAALTATLALKFSPAMRYGQRVKSQKTIEVNFDPYENINKP